MNLKKWGIGISILALFVLGLVITFSNVNLRGDKYEVINSAPEIESKQEVDSVINVIENESYQKINKIDKSVTKEAYVLVDDNGINSIDSAKLLALGKDVGIKFTFVDQKNLNKKLIESEGHTVIPNNKEVQDFINSNDSKTVSLNDGIRVKLLNNDGIIIFINNISKVENNDLKVKSEINGLKEKGYSFKALL